MGKSGALEARLRSKKGQAVLAELYGRSGADKAVGRCIALAAALVESHGEESLRFYSAPGRTELGGNHTDHNRGRVLCAAIRLDILACVAPLDEAVVRIQSDGFPEAIEVGLDSLAPRPEERGSTAALVRGVASGLHDRGIAPRGFAARINSRIPVGSGLSSSAAIEVLLAVILCDLAGAVIPPLEIARIAQAAENDYFGKPSGLMDQSASASGGILALDFRDPERPLVSSVEFDFRDAGYDLLVVDTGGSHADLTADYAAIPEEMRAVARFFGQSDLRDVEHRALVARGPEIRAALGDRSLLRALHFSDENIRVPRMLDALKKGRIGSWLKLVRKSGDSSWKLLQNLQPSGRPGEQGLCIALALSADFLGNRGVARVHGGGFAGTIQAYVPRRLRKQYTFIMESYFGPASVIPLALRGRGAGRVSIPEGSNA